MQPPNWTEFLQCCVCTNKFDSAVFIPISLSCGHSLCTKCLSKLKTRVCPYDKNPIGPLMESLPKNFAILQLLEEKVPPVDNERYPDLAQVGVAEDDRAQFLSAMEAIDKLALFLLPLADQGLATAVTHLTKPMLKKLVSVVGSQVFETEGRARSLRAARSIADRTVTELLVMHQNQQQISTLLWTAVKNRGCQFLGPVMQEEALKLVLMVLQSGKFMARKTIVLYVVQKLLHDFPQASKTSVGHVVQLLYRASCFNVEKRPDDSSLMQLKEEFRSYELLRREHDAQIIRMAMEAGLRISPEQWSSLLYGDHKHKSEMQSIIDKLISQGAASSGLSELIVAVGRSQDPYNLSEKIIPHLEALLKNDITNNEKCAELADSWSIFGESMHSLLNVLQGFSTFMQIQSGRFKTGLCPFLSKPDGCPKGDKCTYAHTEEEREHYRVLSKGTKAPKARTEPIKMGVVSSRPGQGSRGRHSGDLGPARVDISPYSSLGRYQQSGHMGAAPIRDHHYIRQSSHEGSSDSGLKVGYPYTDEQLLHHPQFTTGHSPDASLQVVQQVPPTKPHPTPQAYTPAHEQFMGVGYTSSTASHYHTGPLPQHQVWYEETSRGVVTADQSYYSNQDQKPGNHSGSKGYILGDKQYHSSLPQELSANYGRGYINGAVQSSQSTMADQLSDVRRLHELVNQSVDIHTTQHQTTYPSYEWSKYPQDQTYISEQEDNTTPSDGNESGGSNSFSSYPPQQQSSQGGYLPYVSSASLSEAGAERSEQSVIRVSSAEGTSSKSPQPENSTLDLQMANLNIGTSSPPPQSDPPPSTYPDDFLEKPAYTSTRSGELEPVYEHSVDTSSSGFVQSDSQTISSPSGTEYSYPPLQPTVAYPYNTVSSSDVRTVTSGSGYPIPSASRNNEEELKDQILRLERELKAKNATIEEQQAAMHWSGQKTVQPNPQVVPRSSYSVGGSAMIGSPHHSGLIQQHHSYSGPVQYSPHGTMQHQYSPHGTMQHQYSPHGTMQHQYSPQTSMREYQHPTPVPSPAPQPGVGSAYYTPQVTPPSSFPHQWSGPLSAPSGRQYVSPAGSLPPQPNPTPPPGAGYIIQQQQTGGLVLPTRLEPSDDGMIAAYLQALEQEKAAAASALNAGFQHGYSNQVNPVVMQGGYQMRPNPPPPRHQYHGSYKYTC